MTHAEIVESGRKWNEWATKARELIRPPFVGFKLHTLPHFMRQAIREWAKANRDDSFFAPQRDLRSVGTLTQILRENIGVTLDHWGSAVSRNGLPIFVNQPYGMQGSGLYQCELWAEQCGLSSCLLAASEHYPGWTFAHILYPSNEKFTF